jgi:excinuclease UvrABC nuclease subunit
MEPSPAQLPPDLFDGSAAFEPASPAEALLPAIPGRWAVYLFADAENRPVQLLCVRNLRASVKRRLFGDETGDADATTPAGPTKRIDYKALVRHVHWRRVDSTLEQDLAYFAAAKALFPQQYRQLVPQRPAWFVHVDPDAPFPRYVRTESPVAAKGEHFGPIAEKGEAAKFVADIEDAFDLCRYYNVLTQAPAGRACAYKEMGKCPAPCDGTIAIDQYRRMIEQSAQFLADPHPFIRAHEQRMKSAAAELKFETAQKIKSYVDQLTRLTGRPFHLVKRLRDFGYVSIQPGPGKGKAKAFLTLPGAIVQVASVIDTTKLPAGLVRCILETAERLRDRPLDDAGIELLGLAASHLFAPAKHQQGVVLPLIDAEERTLAKALKQVGAKGKADEEEPADADEGVVREAVV